MIWAIVSSQSCFCWLYRASPSLAAKTIINLISVLTIWWCPCVESSPVLLEDSVCYDQCVFLAKFYPTSKEPWLRGCRTAKRSYSTFKVRRGGGEEIPRVTGKFCLEVHNESAQMLIKFSKGELTGHSKHSLPNTQERTLHIDISRWSKPKSDWLYSLQPKMEKLYTVSKNKTGSWLWLRSWTPYCQIQN